MTEIRIAVMTTLLPLVVAILAADASVVAQDEQQTKYAGLRDEKMASKVFERAPWTFDYDEACRRAKFEDKLIFAYFTRSYAA